MNSDHDIRPFPGSDKHGALLSMPFGPEQRLRSLLLDHGQRRAFEDGAIIEMDAAHVGLVVSGGLGAFADVDRLCVTWFGPQALYCEHGADRPSSAVLQSVGTTVLALVTRGEVVAALGEVEAERVFAAIASASCGAAQDAAIAIGSHPILRRVASWLDRLAPDAPACLELTQERMSQLLGAQRTSANCALQALRDQGVIRFSRGRIAVRDRMALRAIAAGERSGSPKGTVKPVEHSAVMQAG